MSMNFQFFHCQIDQIFLPFHAIWIGNTFFFLLSFKSKHFAAHLFSKHAQHSIYLRIYFTRIYTPHRGNSRRTHTHSHIVRDKYSIIHASATICVRGSNIHNPVLYRHTNTARVRDMNNQIFTRKNGHQHDYFTAPAHNAYTHRQHTRTHTDTYTHIPSWSIHRKGTMSLTSFLFPFSLHL